MRDAFVLAPEEFTPKNLLAAAGRVGLSVAEQGDRIWGGDADDYVDVFEDPTVERDFDEEELAGTKICPDRLRFYHVRFRDHLRAGDVVLQLFGERDDFVLDNDHGLLIDLREFAEAIASAPEWDWSVASSRPT